MSVDTRLEELGVSDLDVSVGEVDEATFSGLAERHRRELHVHCYRMLGSFEDAEDTVQETFLRAWRRRETFEGRSTFRAWLYRIATNACLDLLAKRRPEARDRRRGAVAAALPGPAARRAARGRRGRAGGRRRRAGDDRAGLRRRRPAPRAAPAGRADPAGRARLAGEGRRGAPRRLRQLREQRAAAGPRRHAGAPARRAAGLDRRRGGRRDARAGTPLHRGQRGHGRRQARRHAARRRPLLDAAHAGPVRRPRRGGGRLGRGAASRACRGCAASPPP